MSGSVSLLSSTEQCSLGVSSDLVQVSSNPLTSPRLVKEQEGGGEEERLGWELSVQSP